MKKNNEQGKRMIEQWKKGIIKVIKKNLMMARTEESG